MANVHIQGMSPITVLEDYIGKRESAQTSPCACGSLTIPLTLRGSRSTKSLYMNKLAASLVEFLISLILSLKHGLHQPGHLHGKLIL